MFQRCIYTKPTNLLAMKYRSRSEIIAMILQAANNGATKTRIMYGAYLSYAQVKEYLEFLQGKQLLRYEDGTQLYRLTEKGMQYLRAFDQISDMVSVNKNNRSIDTTPPQTRSPQF
jgi:predicted transcriptional regulator